MGTKRVIAFSDTHGRKIAMQKIIDRKADIYIFLGDGENELEEIKRRFPEKVIYSVRGNCDCYTKSPVVGSCIVNGIRIVFTHGHNQRVNFTDEYLFELARQNGARIVLFGHTHCRLIKYKDGVYAVNPGSASQPRDGLPPSYAFIDITDDGQIFCAHTELH